MHNLIGSLNDVKKKVPNMGTFFFLLLSPPVVIDGKLSTYCLYSREIFPSIVILKYKKWKIMY